MELSAGTRLGPCEIVDYIGAGAMGVVYKARDTRLGRDVVIKVLPPMFARDACVGGLLLFPMQAEGADGLDVRVLQPIVHDALQTCCRQDGFVCPETIALGLVVVLLTIVRIKALSGAT